MDGAADGSRGGHGRGGHAIAARRRRRAAAAPAERPATRWEHRLLAGFFVTLVIPGSFSVAGFTLSASRLFLLLAFVPLFLHWFRGRAWRITAGDVGILLYCFWIWVALFAVHGPGRVPFAGIQFVEMFGGYLVGRTLVRSAEDYRTFVRYLFWTMAFLFPFALAEFLTGWSPLRAHLRGLPHRRGAHDQPPAPARLRRAGAGALRPLDPVRAVLLARGGELLLRLPRGPRQTRWRGSGWRW